MSLFVAGFINTNASANKNTIPNLCMDMREVRLSACPKGQQWFAAKGDCKDIYQAEAVYCANADMPNCTDRRTTFYPPCQPGEVMRFAQGRCQQPTEVEYVYCKKTK